MKSTPGNSEAYLLNSQRVRQILLEPAFFHDCAAYFFLLGLVRDCQIAGRASKYLLPAVTAFARHTVKLHEADPELLGPLREYLRKKLGYTPSRFVLYYKESGQRREVSF